MTCQFSKNASKQAGFTLIEMMVGILIIAATASTVFYGVGYARAEIRKIIIRERALEELTGYMDFWIARINYGNLSQGDKRGDARGEDVIIYNPTGPDHEAEAITAKIYRENMLITHNPEFGDASTPYYFLKARIVWSGHLSEGDEQEIYLESKVFDFN